MRLVTTEGKTDWRKILLMLAVTALSGYLATKSQRAGGAIDVERTLKMRAAHAGSTAAWMVANRAQRAAAALDRMYLNLSA
jgi:hypothetical protein